MYKAIFVFDDFKFPHIGYTSGRLWNGWATPYFEVDEALQIMEEFNKEREEKMTYDEETDSFRVAETEYIEEEIWKGENINTEDGIKHLYGIGAYCYIWDSVTDDEIRAVAQEIEEFLWDFDTYENKDCYADREELVDVIAEQLLDLQVLKQVLIALYNEELTEHELFEKLGKELMV